MVQLYYRLVASGVRTIEQVPVDLRAQVQTLIDADKEQIAN